MSFRREASISHFCKRDRFTREPDSDQICGYIRAQGKKTLLRAQRRFARVLVAAAFWCNGIEYGERRKLARSKERKQIRFEIFAWDFVFRDLGKSALLRSIGRRTDRKLHFLYVTILLGEPSMMSRNK